MGVAGSSAHPPLRTNDGPGGLQRVRRVERQRVGGLEVWAELRHACALWSLRTRPPSMPWARGRRAPQSAADGGSGPEALEVSTSAEAGGRWPGAARVPPEQTRPP